MSEQERDKKFEEIYKDAPTTEPERQYYFMEQARKLVKKKSEELGRPLFFCCVTFGCQMNR